MGCNLPCDPECKKTLGNQGRPCMPAWGALGRRPWPPPWPGGARPSRREGSAFGTQRRGILGMLQSLAQTLAI